MTLALEFDRGFELKLLALQVREPEKAHRVIEPADFSIGAMKAVSRVIREAHEAKKGHNFRLTFDSLWPLVMQDLRSGDAIDDDNERKHRKIVKKLFDVSIPDGEIIWDLAAKFAKKRRYQEALIRAEQDVNIGSYESVHKRFRSLEAIPDPNAPPTRLVVKTVTRFLADENIDEQNHLVYPIVPRGGAVLLYGLPKELKSWFGAALAVDASAGQKALGFFPVERPIRTLYVQVEDPSFLTRDRLKELAYGQGLKRPFPGFLRVVSRCPLNLMDATWLEEFKREVLAHRTELIIFDVFRRLFRGNVSDAQATADFLRVIDSLRDDFGCAIVLVHHARKAETNDIRSRALGSVNLTGWGDVLLFTEGKRQVGESSVADLFIESKITMHTEEHLVITVNSDEMPVVQVWSKNHFHLDLLRNVIGETPGLNQEKVIERSGLSEKLCRTLLKEGLEKGLWVTKKGVKKELFYFLSGKG